MIQPTPPIELTGSTSRIKPAGAVVIPADLLGQLEAICPTLVAADDASRFTVADVSRDWWPLALHWSLAGEVPHVAAAACRPTSTQQVADLLRLCNAHGIPVTAAGGRSGVCGASTPIFGGIVLDTTGLVGIQTVDAVSGIVEVLPGTFGPDMEAQLRADHGLTVGHFPQSFDIATVGGWVACRGAGQYSTRYGKIEDMVVGLEVVLADGSIVRTGGFPAGASGPDLNHLFVGSEGTLGVITRVWLRAHPLPEAERRAAYSFATFEEGIEACRAILRRGATPAVLRLYDAPESKRGQGGDGIECVLLVLDEGDTALVFATMAIVDEECSAAKRLSADLVERWMHHRNDTSALQGLTRKGFVVDTLEIAAPWSALNRVFDEVRTAMLAVEHARTATCHLSHSYLDGACLYFTFAATPPPDRVDATYVAMWDAGQRAVLAAGGNLSHHHGVGLNRARFMPEALGTAMPMLQTIKQALDPRGILNPGKMGFASPFGEVGWP
jgi:alkyldihydroxyacetonephosphate synthase